MKQHTYFISRYLFLIIGWELRVSKIIPLRSGPRGRTDGVGAYKTPGMRESVRAQRGRARSALFYRVMIIPVVCCRILSNSAPNSASADIRLKAWESSKGFQFCFLPPGATAGGSDVNVDDEELELVR